jgi:hypothetical protein
MISKKTPRLNQMSSLDTCSTDFFQKKIGRSTRAGTRESKDKRVLCGNIPEMLIQTRAEKNRGKLHEKSSS